MTAEEDSTPRWKVAMDAAIKVALPILLAVSSWTFTEMRNQSQEIQALKVRVQVIEATGYTRADAALDKDKQAERLRVIVDALSDIKVMLARLEAQRDKDPGAK